jgi:Ribbon-helix-helix protein, copG family.
MAPRKAEPRTKLVSVTFTEDEYEAVKKAALMTDRSLAALVRWAAIKYLREMELLPTSNEIVTEDTKNETIMA